MSWGTLPAELRQMILEFLTPTYLEMFGSERPLCPGQLLEDLDKSTSRVLQRRLYVKRIHLRISLAEYDCTGCRQEEDEKSQKKNNAIFTKAITDLLTVLSKWPETKRQEHPKTPASERGIYLDTSTFAPSDCRHRFRDLWLQPDYPIWFTLDAYADNDLDFPAERERAAQLQAEEPFHDPSHGWKNGHQGPVALGARKRVTETLTLSGKGSTLPVVNLVTSLAIRRQSTRAIKTDSAKKLLDVFPNLHHFTHEPWHAATAERQQIFERDYLSLLQTLPRRLPHLQALTLFQDNSPPFGPTENKRNQQNTLVRPNTSSLTKLYASFLVDAYDFFHGFGALPPQLDELQTWDALKRLCLTSPWLRPTIATGQRQQVLARAGRAATLMPRLERMVLWNGGEGFVYIVMYNRAGYYGGSPPTLVLVSSFRSARHHDFSPDVVAVWSEVPRRRAAAAAAAGEVVDGGDLQVSVWNFPNSRYEGATTGFGETLDVVWGDLVVDVVHGITALCMELRRTS
ncbi:hypothetical protein B0H66DRAFT_641543 [Apodospora peruviana]|uniref:DUF6546 domain-containing protein n=1 Tax=Apodospora peruviana TaxID=516989 RepID=A0AAE0M2D4_9PEZI|nr:hypothetical protein B0H66DRAFT_641543 [Apodospora peruviana]